MNGITNDMYYGGIALRELIEGTDARIRTVAAVSALALGLGVAAVCYFAFRHAKGKGGSR